jgi:hypothetical protein
MVTSLLVLAVLQFSSDAPRLTVPKPPAYSLLAPVSGPVGAQGRLLAESDQAPEAGPSHDPDAPEIGRAIGGFFAGAGLVLVAGSLIYVIEAIGIFGASILGFLSGGNSGVSEVLVAGGLLMVGLNAPLMPLLSALPVHGIAQGDPKHRYSFLATWLSGVITYAATWGLITLTSLERPDRGWVLVNYGSHLGSWILATFVQTVVVQSTRESIELPTEVAGAALLNVDGRRVAWGAPLPTLMPDRSRPGQMVTSVLLAQGRF